MVRVKICGITSVEDGLHAARCGADALGFVFYDKSPRCVTPQVAREIICGLPPFVTTVGLFVNEQPGRVSEIAAACGLDVVQLHGDEAPEKCLLPPHRVIKALRVRDAASIDGVDRYPVSALLLDAWVEGAYGGTGRSFNWQLAAEAARGHQIILAGGLSPSNVADAIAAVRPYGVDVSSGVEAAPGRKDRAKVEAFVSAAKNALSGRM